MKNILIIVLAFICLQSKLKGQDKKAIDVTSKGIQIGQKVPDITINNIHNYKTKSVKLSDFKGKLIILDFWATWCSPCVAMIPKMDSLQRQFGDQIQFLSVTSENDKVVLPFLEKFEEQKKKHYNLPMVTDNNELMVLFPHIYLPHYVWIDQNRVVLAITGLDEVSSKNIDNALKRVNSEIAQKHDMKIEFDKSKPLFINGNGGNTSNMTHYSIFTGYTEGLSAQVVNYNKDFDVSRMQFTNVEIGTFFKTAYFNGGSQTYDRDLLRINVKDPSKIIAPKLSPKEYLKWKKNGNGFCYELSMPKVSKETFFRIMRAQLDIFFPQYKAEVKKVKEKRMALIRTSVKDKIKAVDSLQTEVFEISKNSIRMRNSTLNMFIMRTGAPIYRQGGQEKYLRLINKTNYVGKVDLNLKVDITDIPSMNVALSKYDLKFVETEIEVEKLFISDAM